MFETQQVTGAVAPGQYGAMRVSGAAAYYPAQTDWTAMISMFMPMIMMVMMLAIMVPMFKGITASARD